MGTHHTTSDPGPYWAWVRLSATIEAAVARQDARSVDPSMHAAIDAILLAYRTGRASALSVALIWVAFRAGLVLGRRERRD